MSKGYIQPAYSLDNEKQGFSYTCCGFGLFGLTVAAAYANWLDHVRCMAKRPTGLNDKGKAFLTEALATIPVAVQASWQIAEELA